MNLTVALTITRALDDSGSWEHVKEQVSHTSMHRARRHRDLNEHAETYRRKYMQRQMAGRVRRIMICTRDANACSLVDVARTFCRTMTRQEPCKGNSYIDADCEPLHQNRKTFCRTRTTLLPSLYSEALLVDACVYASARAYVCMCVRACAP